MPSHLPQLLRLSDIKIGVVHAHDVHVHKLIASPLLHRSAALVERLHVPHRSTSAATVLSMSLALVVVVVVLVVVVPLPEELVAVVAPLEGGLSKEE